MINRFSKFVAIFLLLVVCALNVLGTGSCVLDQYYYSPAQKASFVCSCTLPNEENVDGNIVWVNSTGHVLRTLIINSGNCRTSIFGDNYVFLAGADYLGNATFNTTSANWDDAGDIVYDDYNVTGATATDCIIDGIIGSPTINLGEYGSVKFTVTDAITRSPLVHAYCTADGYTVGGAPLVFEPYNDHSRPTQSTGESGFTHFMSESFWSPNTTYLWEFHCHCTPNETEEQCYDETTGIVAGFKSCTVQQTFTTGTDNRYTEGFGGVLVIIILLPMILCFCFLFGAATLNEIHSAFRIFLFLLSFACFWSSSHFGMIALNRFYSFPELRDLIGTTTYWTGYIFFIFISYFFLYLIYLVFSNLSKRKQEKMEY